MRRIGCLALLLVFVYLANPLETDLLRSGTLYAQGWQLYTEELKQDLAQKKSSQKAVASPGSAAPSPANASNSGETAIPIRAFSSGTDSSTPTSETTPASGSTPAPGTVTAPKTAASQTPTPVSSKASASNGRKGLLDFSEVLGEPAPEWTADELTLHREDVEKKSAWAASIPSCRTFPEMRNDACINDIFFLNPQKGIAVGNRGTLWQTSDGGNHWILSNLTTDANFYSVHFCDLHHGVIVGGSILPGSGNGRGIILLTSDGGQNWKEIQHPSFPILRKVRFENPRQVWLAGDSSELYPGGIFTSIDGGQTWTAAVGNRHRGWKRLLYHTQGKTGIGIDLEGMLQRSVGALRTPVELPVGNRRLHDLCQVRPTDPIRLVGERGLLLESRDQGVSWSSIPLNLPENGADQFDLRTVWSVGDKIIAAGSPGTALLTSLDAGKTWTAIPTGISADIESIVFSDPMNGWAAGQFGTVLATHNGGVSWTLQRKGGVRPALLGLFGNGTEIPLELFAWYCGEEGYLGKVLLPGREQNREKRTDEISWYRRLDEALVQVGADGLDELGAFRLDDREWNFSAEKILARFDRENDSKGLDRFRESLVRQIRVNRPDILIVQNPESSSFAALIDRELPRALQAAADPTIYPEQQTVAFLSPWRVTKVYRLIKDEKNKFVNDPNGPRQTGGPSPGGPVVPVSAVVPEKLFQLDSARFCPSLGRSIAENARQSRSFLDQEMTVVPKATSLKLLFESQRGATPPDADPFTGLNIGYGTDARRFRQRGLVDLRDELVRRDGRRREIIGIGLHTTGGTSKGLRLSGEALLPQLTQMVEGADPEMAVEYLLEVGRSFADQGNMTAAEEVYSLVAMEFPRHPMTREALLWLVQFYSGMEPHWSVRQKNRMTTGGTVAAERGANARVTRTRQALDSSVLGSRHRNANELGKMIREAHPELYMDPEVRFPLAVVQRQMGYNRNALSYYLHRSMISKDDLWGIRAQAEYWLLTPNKEALPQGQRLCPLPTLSCRAITGKPYLDGILEPEIWGDSLSFDFSDEPIQEEPKNLENDNSSPNRAWQQENRKRSTRFGTRMAILYDNEFLYIGIIGKKVAGVDYSDDNSPRIRDAELTSFDRVELAFDLDRDYTTACQFVFDYRGWVNESNWKDKNWNPVLFVAKRQTEEFWSLEIAVPWEELADKPPTRADVWAISARRIVPNIGMECWNSENSENGEKGFGFLTFGF